MSKELFEAAASGDYTLVRKIFNRLNYEINYLGSVDEYPGVKYTPLAIALLNEHWTVAMMLISEGADVMMPGKVMDNGINYPISIALKNTMPYELTKTLLKLIPDLNCAVIRRGSNLEHETTLGALIISDLPEYCRPNSLENLYPLELLLRGPQTAFSIYNKKNCRPYITASLFKHYLENELIDDKNFMNIELGLQCLLRLVCLSKTESCLIMQVAEKQSKCSKDYTVRQNLQQQLNNIQQRQDQIEKKLDKIINALGEKQSKPSFTMY